MDETITENATKILAESNLDDRHKKAIVPVLDTFNYMLAAIDDILLSHKPSE